jgi:hypothetical protein
MTWSGAAGRKDLRASGSVRSIYYPEDWRFYPTHRRPVCREFPETEECIGAGLSLSIPLWLHSLASGSRSTTRRGLTTLVERRLRRPQPCGSRTPATTPRARHFTKHLRLSRHSERVTIMTGTRRVPSRMSHLPTDAWSEVWSVAHAAQLR